MPLNNLRMQQQITECLNQMWKHWEPRYVCMILFHGSINLTPWLILHTFTIDLWQVKLAEDMVARGSLTSSLSHLLQNYLNTSQTFGNTTTNMSRLDNVSPTITIRGDNPRAYPPPPPFGVSGQNAAVGLQNADNLNNNSNTNSIKNGVSGDAVSCISDMWPWESHVSSASK